MRPASRTPARSPSDFQCWSAFATSGLLPGSAVIATFFHAFNRSRAEESDESGLIEVVVGGQGVGQPRLAHQDEADGVTE